MKPASLRAALIGLCLAAAALPLRAEIIDIDSAALEKLLAAGVPLVDIRTAEEWQETGVIPGSHPITLFDRQGRFDAPTFLGAVGQVAAPDAPVIVICRSGNRTRMASRLLDEANYRRVYNVRQGMRAWMADRRPLTAVNSSCLAKGVC